MEVKIPSFLFYSPATVSISGMTSSGKTFWIKQVIKHRATLFKVPPKRVIYCYGAWQKIFEDEDMREVEFIDGIPSNLNTLGDGRNHTLLVLDDLMESVVSDIQTQHMFTKTSHHQNISVFYLNQNMYCQGKCARSINLNCHYLVLFKNLRDVLQVGTLGKQMGMKKLMQLAYKDATAHPYGYLFVDLSPHNNTPYKLKSHVIPDKMGEELDYMLVYSLRTRKRKH